VLVPGRSLDSAALKGRNEDQRRTLEWADVRASAEDRENDKRDQIEQKNSYLEDAHPSVMKSVELITGQAKPSAMDAKHPIVREHEDQEPYQQYSVVDDRTP
jgi:hypothetical protein